MEMQEAARAVVSENKLLRALLAEKGVSNAEVTAFLGDRKGTAISTPPGVATRTFSQKPLQDLSEPKHKSICSSGPDWSVQGQKDRERSISSTPDDASKPCPDASKPCPDHAKSCLASKPLSESNTETPHNPSQIQCDDAANILAGYRGHGDLNRARAELGCQNTDCSITNTALFDTLDSDSTVR